MDFDKLKESVGSIMALRIKLADKNSHQFFGTYLADFSLSELHALKNEPLLNQILSEQIQRQIKKIQSGWIDYLNKVGLIWNSEKEQWRPFIVAQVEKAAEANNAGYAYWRKIYDCTNYLDFGGVIKNLSIKKMFESAAAITELNDLHLILPDNSELKQKTFAKMCELEKAEK